MRRGAGELNVVGAGECRWGMENWALKALLCYVETIAGTGFVSAQPGPTLATEGRVVETLRELLCAEGLL